MTLTINPAPGRIGPGALVYASSTLVGAGAPYSARIRLRDMAPSEIVFADLAGLATATAIGYLGVSGYPGVPGTLLEVIQGQRNGLADGAAVQVSVTIWDHLGAVVEAGAVAGYAWDGTTFLLNLIYALQQNPAHDPMLDDILAAVTVQAY